MKETRETRYSSPLKRRISALGGGAFFLLLGLIFQHQGRFVWTNYYGQNIFSVGIVVIGGLIILLALLPKSWVTKFAVIDKKRPIRFHNHSTRHPGKD